MKAPPKRLLLVKPSSFGDIVQSLAVLAPLRRTWPEARVDWLVKDEWAGLLERHPLIDSLLVFPEAPRQWPGFFRALRRGGYDAVIDLQGLFRSGIIARATGAPLRAGFADGREGSPWCYTRRVSACSTHAVDRYLELIRGLGIPTAEPVTFPLPAWEAEDRWAEQFVPARGFLCLIHPAARWPNKLWPAERYGELADWLVRARSCKVVFVAGKAEADQAARAAACMRAPAINLAGQTTLPQLGALVRRAAMLVTNDSGPMHLAAAAGTPVVAIFGPTDPAKVGPYGSRKIVLKKEFDCSRCRRGRCARALECLRLVTVEDVKEAVRRLTEEEFFRARVP
ncbi:MAG TPA: glycosyltransferase family 9 protein [Candidatus Acidoferrales bacterium]|nr:glycosyltransferase family 9 protein [Candidatus Acidoferrales bacterium]